ncbi:MAG: hypothetical protein AB7V58_03240 [Solirubrobacterales bacterium]
MSAPAGDRSTFRRELRATVVESVAAYGYTLTIFATGSVGDYRIGTPHVFEVLIYIGGAVLGFLAVELLAFGRLQLRPSKPPPSEERVWGHTHFASAGIAVFASWALTLLVSTNVAWVLIGFLATTLYLLLSSAQRALAASAAS